LYPEESQTRKYWCQCPIYILFREVKPGIDYAPYEPAIEGLVKSIFQKEWGFDPRVTQLRHDFDMFVNMRRAYGN
jgi:hypothetical protein